MENSTLAVGAVFNHGVCCAVPGVAFVSVGLLDGNFYVVVATAHSATEIGAIPSTVSGVPVRVMDERTFRRGKN